MDILEYALNKKMFGGSGNGEPVIPDGYIKPEGWLIIKENGTFNVKEYANAKVNVPVPDGYIQPTGTIELTENGTHDVTKYASAEVNVPVPDGYIQPTDTIELTKNGTFDVTAYAEAIVDVFVSGDVEEAKALGLSEFLEWRNGDQLFHMCKEFTTIPLFDTNIVTSMTNMFSYCTALTTVPLFDTSNVTNMTGMFVGCTALTTVPLFDTSNVTLMTSMFADCTALTTVPLFDTSNVTLMTSMFEDCTALTTVPLFDTSNVTNMRYMFANCTALTTVPSLDIRSSIYTTRMFESCSALTDCRLRNIELDLQVGSGTSWGHLLTVDSLTHLIYELRDTGSTKTLTVGSANLAKLANVYVKLVDITDEMRAEDDLIDEKLPFEVCESTDEGAALITDYVAGKNWSIV